MTPLEQLHADLTRARAKLGRLQGQPPTQTHTLDLIGDVLLLLDRYTASVIHAGPDPAAPATTKPAQGEPS